MKTATKKLFLALLCLCTAFVLRAQTTVTGIVTDQNGEPLIGAGVLVEGTTTGTVTGIDGDYSITVPADAKNLVFSFIGLADSVEPIDGRTQINVTLKEDTKFLDEVVVIGYAAVKRRDVMGSVTSVDSKTITAAPVSNVSEALSGKMAGVQVTTTEGEPDADIKIRVRGSGSITQDSSPLYIVDGFPVESISDIAASDIQSIDVLKDAFSTAIYGSRGANGVVIVTTKSGEQGKISLSYNAYYGGKWMANRDAIEVMSPYEYVRTQYELASVNDKIDERYTPLFGSFADIDLYENVPGNNWVDQLFGNTGSTFSHNLMVSGSGDKVKWSANYAHINENAIMTGSKYHRDNLSFKTQYKPIKQLTFDLNLRYSHTKVLGAGANSINDAGSTSGSNARLKHAVIYSPIPLANTASDTDMEEEYGDNAPPLVSVADNDKKRVRSNWTLNGAVTWHIIKNLNLRVEGGLDSFKQQDNQFYGLTSYYVANTATKEYQNHPAAKEIDYSRLKIRNTNTLNYKFDKIIPDKRHKLDLMVGEELVLTKSQATTLVTEGYPDFFSSTQAWQFMSSAEFMRTANTFYDPNDILLSFFGRVNYDFDGRYSLSATVRADGSSRFMKGNQWGVFPSAAAAWTISNEPWMQNAHWLDNLKLRYSFGTAGNNNIPSGVQSMTFSGLTSASAWIYNSTTPWATTSVDGKIVMPNPDLTWETTWSHNIGIDFAFFKSRLTGSIELYHNTIDKLLIQFPTSGSGYTYQYRNTGTIVNKGIELSLSAVLVEQKNWGLTLSGNIALNKNVVKSLGDLDRIEAYSNWASTKISPYADFVVEENQPLGNVYGYKVDGYYTVDDFNYNSDNGAWTLKDGVVDCSNQVGAGFLRPGVMKLKDEDGDGKPDLQIIGNTLPLGTGGFSLSGTAYGVDFAANFNYVFGNKIYNANKIEFTSTQDFWRRNLLKSCETGNRWTNVNWETGELISDPAELAAANEGVTMWSPLSNRVVTDWALEDGSFLRLSSATIGYTLPESVTSKIKMKKLRFYVTGTNLFCITKYSGFDPEVDSRRATPLTPGVDYSAYPKSIGVVGGINITF
ncbi:MAG: TonB-dependent receptor [Bacteroidales bacterium]|nr:TonB-dependent receptor [Bacteroidales bacterium]